MANIGFESAIFNIDKKEYVVDKEKGGAIEANISGLGSSNSTLYASDVPFFVTGKGVSSPKVELKIADLADNGLYTKIIGAETVDGATVIGSQTQAPYTSLILISSNKEGKRMFMGMTKGKFSAPDVALKTGEDSGTEVQTDSISGDFIADSRGYVYLTAVEDEEMTLEKFKGLVNGPKVTE